jgi:hypothetical protein
MPSRRPGPKLIRRVYVGHVPRARVERVPHLEDYRGWQFLHDNPHTTMQPPALEEPPG